MNAILAASVCTDVVGVDITPRAVETARANAASNGVAERTSFMASDAFDAVQGTFDLIVIDPPFRWFAARDAVEASITDENYDFLARFLDGAPRRLRPGGRVPLFFGTSGDLDHVLDLVARAGFESQAIATRALTQDGATITYNTYRLTPDAEVL